jgi:uncharacterized HAD superfamily protein
MIEEILKNVYTNPAQSIGIDLDGTIDESPIFFHILTNLWPGKIYIITYRKDLFKIREVLENFKIKYDEIICVKGFEYKAVEIKRLGISIFFDDMDEVLLHIPEDVTVLKIRNGGNFDYSEKKWVYDKYTGRELKLNFS